MLIWLNGQYCEETEARVSIRDRGFLYGDGVFETMRAYGGKVFRFKEHWERLAAGAEHLGLRAPMPLTSANELVSELLRRNDQRDAVVRFQWTRGPGERGYSTRGADQPTALLTTHALPETAADAAGGMRLAVVAPRLPSFDPIARFKTCNRIVQVLARREAERQGAHEALLLNEKNHVVEAAGANVFWLSHGVLYTPGRNTGLLPGITRGVLFEISRRLDLECVETESSVSHVLAAEAVFLTQSALGLTRVAALGAHAFGEHPLFERLQREYAAAVERNGQ